METMKLPVGVDDFKKLRDNNGYYVDKTPMIHHILSENVTEAFLFTRPRRFGKTLNMSMLDAYLNEDYRGNEWFEGLSISDIRPDDPEKNTNLVLFLTLKDLWGNSFGKFINEFGKTVTNLYSRFMFLENSEKVQPSMKRLFSRLTYGKPYDIDDLTTSLFDLTKMLYDHTGKKSIILIDEYDNAMNKAHSHKEWDELRTFMGQFLGHALKSNPYLKFAVLSGVMKISKENIFSGLNNLSVNDVLSNEYGEMFGFTESEVERICSDFGHPERIDEAREWYDGYRFGNSDVYNPWSIINYVDKGFEACEYWVGTSSNEILSDLVSRTDSNTWSKLRFLSEGRPIYADINRNIVYADMNDNMNSVLSVMVMTGYLNAVPECNGYLVSIPNKEIFNVFAREIMDRFGGGMNSTLFDFTDAVLAGDQKSLTETLRRLIEVMGSRVLTDEKTYEGFVTGMLMTLQGRYEITADHESGDGFHDIKLKRIKGPGSNVIIELKRRNKKNAHIPMDRLAEMALDQAISKQYSYGMTGRTILIGVAFDGKNPTVISRESGIDARIESPRSV